MDNQKENKMHVFEKAGLGKAPFRFTGLEDTKKGVDSTGMVVKKRFADGIQLLTKPGGSCDYCGHYIVIFCWIKSSDGKRFKVGTECVKKTDDKGLYDVIKREVNRKRNDERKKRERIRIQKTLEILRKESVQDVLKNRPHPQKWLADKGMTMLDWANWMLNHAGNRGMIEVCKVVEKIEKQG